MPKKLSECLDEERTIPSPSVSIRMMTENPILKSSPVSLLGKRVVSSTTVPPVSTRKKYRSMTLSGGSVAAAVGVDVDNTIIGRGTEHVISNLAKDSVLSSLTQKYQSLCMESLEQHTVPANRILSLEVSLSSSVLSPMVDIAPRTGTAVLGVEYEDVRGPSVPRGVSAVPGYSLSSTPLFDLADAPDLQMDVDEEQDSEFARPRPRYLEVFLPREEVSPAQLVAVHKARFLHAVSGSLIASPNYKKLDDPRRMNLVESAGAVAAVDPEFVLKTALYTRCNLNVRTTSNFLLAFAATLTKCRPFLKKYFAVTVRLPTDWIDVAEHYEVMSSQRSSKGRCPLPVALRKVMAEKFPEFDEYQLAKHNKQKKTNKKKQRRKGKGSDFAPEATIPPKKSGQNLKKLIRQLHITRPAHLVMGIIGKKYPSDAVQFSRSGLLGVWEEERAGKRMKLTQPETWETQVSARGNKAEVWQDLLDRKKLPYMAMLRNLRNMIKAGISTDHHEGVLKRLQDQNAVIQSKQFPFRFFSAYDVLETLRQEYKAKILQMAAEAEKKPKLKTLGSRIKKTKENWWLLKKKKAENKSINYDEILLDRYQKALDNAVKVATVHNVKPIPGRTVVICNIGTAMDIPCTSAKGLGKPRTAKEIAVLLSLMCKYACEDCRMMVYAEQEMKEVTHLQKGTILDNMGKILSGDVGNSTQSGNYMNLLLGKLESYTVDRTRIDNLLVISNIPEGSFGDEDIQKFLDRFRNVVNPDLLYVNVSLSDHVTSSRLDSGGLSNEKNVYLRGYSEQLLRFMAEKGTEGQLTFVQNIDRVYDVREKKVVPLATSEEILGIQSRALPDPVVSRQLGPKEIRVFVSSTFRDMHAERDILLRCVFPELQRRVGKLLGGGYCLCPVDLRWGVTEEQHLQMSSVEQCLREVGRSHLFVGILGERYGFCPSAQDVACIAERDESFGWLKEYNPGSSVTELEIASFALRDPDAVKGRAYFYFRSPSFLASVPTKFKNHMTSESEEHRTRMMKLKERLRKSCHPVREFSCQWAGIRDGHPVTTGLKGLAEVVAEDTWESVKSVQLTDSADSAEHFVDFVRASLAEQWSFVHYEAEKNRGRKSLVESAASLLRKRNDRIILITGKAASGKTSFMAKLASEARNYITVPCFRDAWSQEPDPSEVIRYLSTVLDRIAGVEFSRQSFRVSKSVWEKAVEAASNVGCGVALFLDGWDDGQINWILETLEPNVVFVVSAREGSSIHQAVSNTKPPPTRLEIQGLGVEERMAVASGFLSAYGKRLDERAFSNQMRLLVSKRQADSPLYIQLVCEYLRVYAGFENVSSELRRLPSAIEPLLREILSRLEGDFGKDLVAAMLAVLYYSPVGLTEEDLYRVCSAVLSCGLSKLTESAHQFQRLSVLPRSCFVFLLSAAKTLFSGSFAKSGLYTMNTRLIQILTQKQDGMSKLKETALRNLIAYSLSIIDPSGDAMFRGSDLSACRYVELLLTTLAELRDYGSLGDLLCDLNFLHLCMKLNACYSVLLAHNKTLSALKTGSHGKRNDMFANVSVLEEMGRFLGWNAEFLSQYPSLLLQEIINQPRESSLIRLAQKYREGVSDGEMILWENKPIRQSACLKSLRVSDTAVTSVAVSPQKIVVVGKADGSISLVSFDSSEELHSFTGHGQAVSCLCFLDDEGVELCSASKDGSVSLWNCAARCKTGVLSGHSAAVSVCRRFRWGKVVSLVTGSWDTTVKLWNTQQKKWTEDIKTGSSVNCLDCHPSSSFIVTGHWDGAIRIYSTAPVRRKAINGENLVVQVSHEVLRGHESSVRCVIFVEDGVQIVSASMDGQIRVWSADHGIPVGIFHGHSLPVTGMYLCDGSIVTTAEDCAVKVWSGNLGVPTVSLSSFGGGSETMGVSAVHLSTDSASVAFGLRDGHVVLADILSGGLGKWDKFVGSLPILKIRFLRTNRWLLIAGTNEAQILSAADGSVVYKLKSENMERITAADCTSDYVVTAHVNGCLGLFDLATAAWKKEVDVDPVAVVFGHNGRVTGCSLSDDSLNFCSVGEDMTLNIWSTGNLLSRKTEPIRVVHNAHMDTVSCCAWSVSQNLIVTGSNDCSLKVWNPEAATCVRTVNHHSGPIVSVDFQKNCIVSASTDGSICVCSARGALVTRLRAPGSVVPVPADCCLNLGEKSVEKGGMDWAQLMENEETDQSPLTAVDSMISSTLLVGFADGSCHLWHPFMGHEKSCSVNHFAPVTGVSGHFRLPGVFVTGDKNGVCNWWELSDSTEPVVQAHAQRVTLIKRSEEDGSLFCSTARDGSICFWKSPYDKPYFTCFAHKKSISGVVWIKADKLVTGSEDGSVSIWEIDYGSKSCSKLSEEHFVSPISYLSLENNSVLSAATWDGKIHYLSLDDISERNSIRVTQTDGPASVSFKTSVACFGKNFLFWGEQSGMIHFTIGNSSEFSSVHAHSEAVTGVSVLDVTSEEVAVVSVSLDRLVKLWKLSLSAKQLHLSGCWRCPSSLTAVECQPRNGSILCGDVIGRIHRLIRN